MKIALLATSLAIAALDAAVMASPASAQEVTHQATAVKPGIYVVEPTHTQIIFSVLHMGFTNYYGNFSNISGTLQLNPAKAAAAQLDITVPINSVSTTSTVLTGKLNGAQWFDAAKYPAATFVSTKVTRSGANSAQVTGTLTLHGMSHTETLAVHFIGAGVNPLDKKYTVGFQATSTIMRSDFGVKTYIPLVEDAVHLTIAGAFELQH